MNDISSICLRNLITHICSQTKLHRSLILMAMVISLLFTHVPALQASGINQWTTGSSNWTATARWTEVAVPGTVGHTNDDILFPANQNGNIALTQSMFPTAAGMTARTPSVS